MTDSPTLTPAKREIQYLDTVAAYDQWAEVIPYFLVICVCMAYEFTLWKLDNERYQIIYSFNARRLPPETMSLGI